MLIPRSLAINAKDTASGGYMSPVTNPSCRPAALGNLAVQPHSHTATQS
jgi:hypothetical protein